MSQENSLCCERLEKVRGMSEESKKKARVERTNAKTKNNGARKPSVSDTACHPCAGAANLLCLVPHHQVREYSASFSQLRRRCSACQETLRVFKTFLGVENNSVTSLIYVEDQISTLRATPSAFSPLKLVRTEKTRISIAPAQA